jgi:hypothetical protein
MSSTTAFRCDRFLNLNLTSTNLWSAHRSGLVTSVIFIERVKKIFSTRWKVRAIRLLCNSRSVFSKVARRRKEIFKDNAEEDPFFVIDSAALVKSSFELVLGENSPKIDTTV